MGKVGRNAPCPCGSGKKYKKCCLLKVIPLKRQEPMFRFVEATSEEARLVREEIRKQQSGEPHLHFVKSVVWHGYRWRPLFQRLHYRPIQETFHEFIIHILRQTFGEEWRKEQVSFPLEKQHVLLRWLKSYNDWRLIHSTDENKADDHLWGAEASGDVLALHQFAYDVYCLQAIHKFPENLVNRLKNNKGFQGARYEVAVAAMIARAGFEIIFFGDDQKGKKQCEFIAKHKNTGIEIGVEAKSRHRQGVLNESGDIDERAIIKGDVSRLVTDALQQRPAGLPYIVFVDLNVLPTPGLPLEKKPWFEDIKGVIDKIKLLETDGRAVENAIILTNYSYYYFGNSQKAPAGESLYLIPMQPETPIKNPALLQEIINSVDRYSVVPVEV